MSDGKSPIEKAKSKAFLRGAMASLRNKSRGENPYHCATSAQAKHFHDWYSGFDKAEALKALEGE